MSRTTAATCKVIRPDDTYDGKQGSSYFEVIAKIVAGGSSPLPAAQCGQEVRGEGYDATRGSLK
jgi:uncharacterized RmlC-like cupin family protein